MPWRRHNPFLRAEEILERFPIPRPGPFVVLGRILLAPSIFAVVMLFVHFVWPERFWQTIARTLGVFVFGKFMAAGGQEDFLYWLFMLGMVDVLTGLFLVWNFDLLFRVPGLGPMLRVMEAKGTLFLEEKAWVRRFAFVGVILIVIVPFQGTGAVMGSIVGRLIGLGPWRALGAIVIGGYTGVTLMLSASALVAFLGGVNPLVAVGALVLLVAAGLVVWDRWFRTRHKAAEGSPAEPAAGGVPGEGPQR